MAEEAKSEGMPPRSRSPMQLVGERQMPDPVPLSSLIGQSQTIPTTIQTTPPNPADRAWRAAVIGSLNVLFVILAVRALVLVAIIGAIILATRVMATPDPWRLGALAIYAVAVVLPTVWLSSRR